MLYEDSVFFRVLVRGSMLSHRNEFWVLLDFQDNSRFWSTCLCPTMKTIFFVLNTCSMRKSYYSIFLFKSHNHCKEFCTNGNFRYNWWKYSVDFHVNVASSQYSTDVVSCALGEVTIFLPLVLFILGFKIVFD